VFGSTHTLFTKIFPKWNIETTYFDATDLDSLDALVLPQTKILYVESPTNPGLQIIDLELLGKFAKSHDLIFIVDNCFATPYLQQPIQYGADIVIHSATTDFCVGVAGYPEKHMEAPSLESDLHFLKKKVEAGANYVVTQMFFDNQKYFAFVEKCRQAGIEVPIIPGLKPMATAKQLNLIPHRFHVDLPEPLIKEVIKCKDNKQVRQVGIEWCINQSKELIDFGVPFLHYYSMGKSDNIHAIAKEVF
jgi:5,10-methylenetetrahydrofolate reductase